jgi:hypothetical protein
VIKFAKWQTARVCYLVDLIGGGELTDRYEYLIQALLVIGFQTQSAVVVLELPDCEGELLNLKSQGFFLRPREECLIVRQSKWPFLHPQSDEFDGHRWKFFPGDGDNL